MKTIKKEPLVLLHFASTHEEPSFFSSVTVDTKTIKVGEGSPLNYFSLVELPLCESTDKYNAGNFYTKHNLSDEEKYDFL